MKVEAGALLIAIALRATAPKTSCGPAQSLARCAKLSWLAASMAAGATRYRPAARALALRPLPPQRKSFARAGED